MMRIADELTVLLWEHPLRVQAPRVLPQCLERPIVQWNFSLTSTFGRTDVSAVDASPDDQLPSPHVERIPRKPGKLTEPKPGVQRQDDHRPPAARSQCV